MVHVAFAHLRTGSLATGLALVDAIGTLFDAESDEPCAVTWMGRD